MQSVVVAVKASLTSTQRFPIAFQSFFSLVSAAAMLCLPDSKTLFPVPKASR